MENATNILAEAGVVVIGRNEGARLTGCLNSALSAGIDPARVVYVDSGSTDGSVLAARGLGVGVVELDPRTVFTAARARNVGLEHLLLARPALKFVQFVDGDCELQPDWPARAARELSGNAGIAIVCGRRRERFPDRSVYNRLCDIEWNTPVGEAEACGGDAMMRIAAFQAAGGFNARLIAGEEPELCVRLRERGGKIFRLDAEMTLHDAAMTRFSQWWRRMTRAGHAYAEVAAMHGKPPTRKWVKENRSNWFWGAIVPLLAIGLAWPTRGLSLLLFCGYAVLGFKIHAASRRRGMSPSVARMYAFFTTLAKFPLMLGQARYWIGRIFGRRSRLIEYKGGSSHLPEPAKQALT